MAKRLFVLALALFACSAAVAQGEEKRERIEAWGTVIDPDRDCKITLESGELVISVPGTVQDLSIELNRMNAPRVMQEVEGDFILQVKVAGGFAPKVQTTKDRYAYHGAGLLLMKDKKTYIRLAHAAVARPDLQHGLKYANFELREDGSPVHTDAHDAYPLEEEQMAYLRLERHGDRVAGAVSADGIKWRYLDPKTVLLPAKVEVGVDAVSTAKEPFAARFSGLKVFQRK